MAVMRTDFISLHAGDPKRTGENEIAGRSYARIQVGDSIGPVKDGLRIGTREVTFENLPKSSVTHVGIWDAVSGGRFLTGGPLINAKLLDDGDSIRFAPGKIIMTVE